MHNNKPTAAKDTQASDEPRSTKQPRRHLQYEEATDHSPAG